MSTEIRPLTKKGVPFYPQTHVKAIVNDNGSGVDSAPTKNSNNLVESGGVFSAIFDNTGAFDISRYNAINGVPKSYSGLTDALSEVPQEYRSGGMSVKYVQSSDNNYVQFRYMPSDAATVATFTNVANWQGVDATPTAGSKNLVESGGVKSKLDILTSIEFGTLVDGQYIFSTNGRFGSSGSYRRTDFLPITKAFERLVVGTGVKVNNVAAIAFYSSNSESSFISAVNSGDYAVGSTIEVDIPNNAKYCSLCWLTGNQDKVFLRIKSITDAIQNTNDITQEYISGLNTQIDGLNTDVQSIDGRVDILDDEIEPLKSNIPITLNDNGYITAINGNVGEVPSYKYTDYIPCINFSSITYLLAYEDAAGIAFYNKDKGYISGIQKSSSENIGDIVTKPVPENACFVRISVQNAMAAQFYVCSLDYAISRYVEANYQNQMEYGLGVLQEGYIVASTGDFNSASSYRATDFIKLVGKRLKYKIYFEDAAGIAFYDKDKTYIVGYANSSGSSAYGNIVEVMIPENAVYCRCCALTGYASYMFLQCADGGTIVDLLSEFESTPTQPVEINPCFYKDSNGCRAFKKILCIGDSLTEGTFEYKDGSSTLTYFVDTELSYPTFLKCLTGRNTTNVGDGGQTTKTWWERHQNDDLSGHDACIIALGRNDYATGRETTQEERYEYMGYIINKVRTENPQIKVFVATMLNYYTGTDADAVNEDMRGIAQTNNCYLLDISAYGQLSFSNDAYSHLTAEGYEKVANYYFNYISYIMAQNPADFKNIQFIGTEHYY